MVGLLADDGAGAAAQQTVVAALVSELRLTSLHFRLAHKKPVECEVDLQQEVQPVQLETVLPLPPHPHPGPLLHPVQRLVRTGADIVGIPLFDGVTSTVIMHSLTMSQCIAHA